MRLFQNGGVYRAYLPRLAMLSQDCVTFETRVRSFLDDRFNACHFLQPVLTHDPEAFFTNGDDLILQGLWARENGLPANSTLGAILLAQIEQHRTEVLYNLDPMRDAKDFDRKLPGCVKKKIAWRAAPSPGASFGAYDAVVCNFPSILQSYRERGWRAEYFSPAHDPEMDVYAANTERPIDVLFVGGYSRHHRRRAVIMEAVAALRGRFNVVFRLDRSRLTRLAESRMGYLLPLGSHRRPSNIRAVSQDPVFGRELYKVISRAKIVLNGAVDMASFDRGNMRCFEALGCGALMLSDEGKYPDGMEHQSTMLHYSSASDAVAKIEDALSNTELSRLTASRGSQLVRSHYSKSRQWSDFIQLVERL